MLGHVEELVDSMALPDFDEGYGGASFTPGTKNLVLFEKALSEFFNSIQTEVSVFLEKAKDKCKEQGWVEPAVEYTESHIEYGYYNEGSHESARLIVKAFRPFNDRELRRAEEDRVRAAANAARLTVEVEAKERELLKNLKQKYEDK